MDLVRELISQNLQTFTASGERTESTPQIGEPAASTSKVQAIGNQVVGPNAKRPLEEAESETSGGKKAKVGPLTLEQKRERDRAYQAKYRAKKKVRLRKEVEDEVNRLQETRLTLAGIALDIESPATTSAVQDQAESSQPSSRIQTLIQAVSEAAQQGESTVQRELRQAREHVRKLQTVITDQQAVIARQELTIERLQAKLR